jgi:malate dehydrogenase (oxaloacetate-decarboxylating)
MSEKKESQDKRLSDAYKPMDEAMRLHPFYKGKIKVLPKCAIRSVDDFAVWYTPGVAAPCKDIHKNPEQVFEHTAKANMIAVISDGTRVLGLGDIGPEAGLPVMEGKCILFKYLGGVDAFPLCLDTKDPDEFIRTCKILQPTFGGYNLEDIEKPKCFRILDTLRAECHIPVWHDDQQGTAAVTVAGLVNALKIVGKKIGKVRVVLNGAGASNIAIGRLLLFAGVDGANMMYVDRKGALARNRPGLQDDEYVKYEMALKTNPGNFSGSLAEALEGADVLISLSQPGPGVVKKEWVHKMAKDSIVFVCANPIPEIWPWEAKEAGARIVSTGRSDFPNQVNNSLGFPGIFRGTLDVMATTITDEMCLAAAYELAKTAEDKGMSEEHLLPTMDEWEVFPREAVAVGQKAIEQGVARVKLTPAQAFDVAERIIKNAREEVQYLMKQGFIPLPPAQK